MRSPGPCSEEYILAKTDDETSDWYTLHAKELLGLPEQPIFFPVTGRRLDLDLASPLLEDSVTRTEESILVSPRHRSPIIVSVGEKGAIKLANAPIE